MPAPIALPIWATNGGTTLEPTLGQKQAGWSAGQRPPARWLNWWKNLTYQWVDWLNTDKVGISLGHLDGLLIGAHECRTTTTTFTATNYTGFVGGKRITPGASATLTPAGLVANTWYYVYADVTIASPYLIQSTTAPDVDLIYENGNPNRLYVGCFRTKVGSNAILPMFRTGRRVTYNHGEVLANDVANSDLQILKDGANLAFTAFSAAKCIPPHARLAHLRMTSVRVANPANFFQIRPTGGATIGVQFDLLNVAGNTEAFGISMVPGNGSQFDYLVDAINHSLDVFCDGFTE